MSLRFQAFLYTSQSITQMKFHLTALREYLADIIPENISKSYIKQSTDSTWRCSVACMSWRPKSYVPPTKVCLGYTPNDQVGEVAAATRRCVSGHAGLPQPRLHLKLFDNEHIVIHKLYIMETLKSYWVVTKHSLLNSRRHFERSLQCTYDLGSQDIQGIEQPHVESVDCLTLLSQVTSASSWSCLRVQVQKPCSL